MVVSGPKTYILNELTRRIYVIKTSLYARIGSDLIRKCYTRLKKKLSWTSDKE